MGKCSQIVLRLETTLQLDMKLCGSASCWEWFALSRGRNRALPTPVLWAGICSSPGSRTLILLSTGSSVCQSLLRPTYPSCFSTRMSWIASGTNVGLADFHTVAFDSTAVCKHGWGSRLAVLHALFLAEDKCLFWGVFILPKFKLIFSCSM